MPISIYTYFCSILLIIIWNYKARDTASKIDSKPCLASLNQLEYFFVCNGIHIANNKELLVVPHNLCNELPKQRERRVCDNHVSLFKKLYALSASEVTATLKMIYSNTRRIKTVAIFTTIFTPKPFLDFLTKKQIINIFPITRSN